MVPSYFQYWGKAKIGATDEYHLLPYHCLDVVAVADVWLTKSSVLLTQISSQIGLNKEKSKAITLFFIALHDLGKFDARFQNFVPSLRTKLQGDAFEVDNEPYSHGSYGYWYFSEEFLTSELMKSVAGHHGFCDTAINFMEPDADQELIELDRKARFEWVSFCLDWFELDEIPNIQNVSMLAGLCSVSDWIGSSMTNFTKTNSINLKSYYDDALSRAEVVLNRSGLISTIKTSGFNDLFPDYQPRGIQKLLPQLPTKPGLTIVESDTGSGKTEFALSYASILIRNGMADGIVFGLPTQATANGLFDRVGMASEILFPDSTITLAHGKSKYFNSKYLVPDENGFLHQSSKRAFLGSMSVATVDQILMGVLGIRHQFVRSFGTRKSVLILDEVHSYDAYMYGLIYQVLKGQHDAYSSVILLSATLPVHQKQQLLKTYNSHGAGNGYPLITHVDLPGETTFLEVPEKPKIREVAIQVWNSANLLPDDVQCNQLIDWADQGAMVGVICNTVQDAQILYSLLRQKTSIEIDLFHARFTVEDRIRIENSVLTRYGKHAARRGRLLVATQVIEQSLDLDFDVLVSQIAPIEFLMQRMGRLWRHERSNCTPELAARSSVIKAPVFITLCPQIEDVKSEFTRGYRGSGFVYKDFRALYRTQKYLEAHSKLIFPDCYRNVIMYVHSSGAYDDEPEVLIKIAETFKNEQDGRYFAAKTISNQHSRPLNDVDPRCALLTRDGEMSKAVVLFREKGVLWHSGNYLDQQDRERNTVSLSNKLAKGKIDEENHCRKAIVGTDIQYSELGIYDDRLLEQLEKLVC